MSYSKKGSENMTETERIENRITKMLENVLFEENEIDTPTTKKSVSDNVNLPIITINDQYYQPKTNYFSEDNVRLQLDNNPRLLLNNFPLKNSSPTKFNNPNGNSNTVKLSPSPNKNFDGRPQSLFVTNMLNNNNLPFNNNTMTNYAYNNKNIFINNTFNNNKNFPNKENISHNIQTSSSNSYLSMDFPSVKIPNKRHSSDTNTNINIGSDIEEILENVIRPNEKLEQTTYELLKGKFEQILSSQNGSRVLQKSLKNTDNMIIDKIFNEIVKKTDRLMVDPYANYFCQRFFNYLNEEQRMGFLYELSYNIREISNSKVGTYPLQAILEQLVNEKERKVLTDSIKKICLDLCQDPQGVHVIEKMIILFNEDEITHIYNTIINNFMLLANNSNGLCVCKKIIIHALNIETIKRIQEQIAENAIVLVQNPYGNYAIQVAFENWTFDLVKPIIIQFFGKFYNLSMHKYSSNVIEKCIESGDEYIVGKFVEEVCNNNKVIDLMKNCYGNYVVQKSLKVVKGDIKSKLIGTITKNIEKLGDKKLISKWKLIVNNAQKNLLSVDEPVNLNISGSSVNSKSSAKSLSPKITSNNSGLKKNKYLNYQANIVSKSHDNSPRRSYDGIDDTNSNYNKNRLFN